MNANLYFHTQSRLCTLRSCFSQSQRPTTHRNQQRTSLRLKPARNEELSKPTSKRKAETQRMWNCKPSAKHGQNTVTTKPSKEKSKSTAKKSTAYSKPTSQKPQKKSIRHGASASSKTTLASYVSIRAME